MAKALSLNVIAEGVETWPQNDFLIGEGCGILQGFLHARPMTFDDFKAFLAKNQEEHRPRMSKLNAGRRSGRIPENQIAGRPDMRIVTAAG